MREFPDIKRKNGGKIQKDLEPNKEPEPNTEPTNQTQAQDEDSTFENLQTLVETIEAENWTDFGFLVFRTDYSNEDL
ncbi:hypothetical protein N7467_000405 [Penicillium canescens]|nr:hypothetical protein N7467_000405 [Penicillium canescens]